MKCTRCGISHPVRVVTIRENFGLCYSCITSTQWIWRMLPNFNEDEAWGESDYMDIRLLVLLQEARKLVGIPFHIHCAYGGRHSENSYHYFGQAVDFHVGEDPKEILMRVWKALDMFWQGGLGLYPYWDSPGFHVDIGPKRRWLCNKEGGYNWMKTMCYRHFDDFIYILETLGGENNLILETIERARAGDEFSRKVIENYITPEE